ncbi:MAG: Holliday junction branch migration protein RuvA [Oscillospiraceae bacterium]|nr:Holliday junction branch migration protein RuvA [Oscillospiraceae bacterium]
MFFYYLNGTVAAIEPNLVVIDCGGVGYECATTAYTISQLKQGQTHKLYTYCNIREDAFEIFGFSTREEKRCFELLLSVSGVGPKAALNILSATTPSGFQLAVASGDEKALTAAQGVGKKLAQRVLLELKDKLKLDGTEAAVSSGGAVLPQRSSHASEAAAALAVLGYSQSEIAVAMKGLNTETMTVEEIVRHSLRAMVMK